jgi:adenosylmethionine-8-amino-7-oxononanoate aminotransferase
MIGLLEQLRTHAIVGDVRGVGLFMAVELVRDAALREGFAPEQGVDDQVAAIAREKGLFVRPFGGTVFLAPPLIFTKGQADRAVDVLDAALTQVEGRLGDEAPSAGVGVEREPSMAAAHSHP